jgi:hypothetical protein
MLFLVGIFGKTEQMGVYDETKRSSLCVAQVM